MKHLRPFPTRLLLSLVLAIVVGGAGFFLWHYSSPQSEYKKAGIRQAQERHTTTQFSEDDGLSKAYENLSNYSLPTRLGDLEFSHLRVTLPQPIDAPWHGPFCNSQTCFDDDKKEAAVEVLPIWIRRAVLAGEKELAARYLWSLIKFTEDKNTDVATQAVMVLYRMGDSNGLAISEMKKWIQSGLGGFRFRDTNESKSEPEDIRAVILRAMDYYHDASLLDTVYETWAKNKNNEGELPASVDFAYYLEKHGKELPSEYWLDRLKSRYGFENALQIVKSKNPKGLTERLQALFGDIRGKPASSIDAGRAASIASALFQLTRESQYRDYLVERSQKQIGSGDVEISLGRTLKSLAEINDAAALQVLSIAVESNNVIIHETAIDALGNSSDPQAVEILFQSAQKAAQEKSNFPRFPRHELHALLTMNNGNADAAYQRLQQALLSGQFGWTAVSSDFEHLDFLRKQNHR